MWLQWSMVVSFFHPHFCGHIFESIIQCCNWFYDAVQNPAERVKAKMRLQLSETGNILAVFCLQSSVYAVFCYRIVFVLRPDYFKKKLSGCILYII
jgi:hypothetical protein